MESILQVVKIEVLPSEKANCNFKKVTFKGVKFLPNGAQVKTNVEGTRNLWPTHEVTLQDGTTTTIKGDVEFDNIMVGDFFDGSVQSFQTVPYELDGKQINTYKCVVFAHEQPLIVAAKNLRQNNSAPLDADGNPFTVLGQPAVGAKLKPQEEPEP